MRKQETSKSGQLVYGQFGNRPVKAYLKSERVEDAARAEQRLKELPGWGLDKRKHALQLVRRFVNSGQAEVFANVVTRLASHECQPATIKLAGEVVSVTLAGHPIRGCVGGLTNAVFRLAAMIG